MDEPGADRPLGEAPELRVRHDGGRNRERRICAEWLTEADALAAMAQRMKEAEAGQITRPDPNRTLGELAEEYLRYKADHGKRSLRDDTRILNTRLWPPFGASLSVRKVTTQMIAQYEKCRSDEKDARRKEMTEAPRVSAYTVTLELVILRHMLRLAKRWGHIQRVPEIV
jgi:hypothetical protein